jgi:hypothetical protein
MIKEFDQYSAARKVLEGYAPLNPEKPREVFFDPFAVRMRQLHEEPETLQIAAKLKDASYYYALKGGRYMPSNLLVATGYFDHILSALFAQELSDAAFLLTASNDPRKFIVFFDAYSGANALNKRLILAEQQFSQKLQPKIEIEMTQTKTELAQQAADQACQDLVCMETLLAQDPSGFSLVDDYILKLKEDPHAPMLPQGFIAPLIPGFYTAGAELWGALYKKVYDRINY